jgi:hypothetical protein
VEEEFAQFDKPHFTRDCKSFQESLVEERAKVVKEKKVCFKCLESGHALKDCAVENKCGIDGCKSGNYRLTHDVPLVSPSPIRKTNSEGNGVKFEDSS